MEKVDFSALVETRVLLEVNNVIKAAERRTADDIIALQKALDAYEEKVFLGELGIEEDLLFHLKIAEASKNTVLKSLMLIIIPDLIESFIQLKVCEVNAGNRIMLEHRDILQKIVDQDSKGAEVAMKNHLKNVESFAKNSVK